MGRVLVVEDDATLLDAVAYNLERDGHEVRTAGDGVSGLALARGEAPDLIVLDLMLPRMSGIDVCRLVREDRPVPIIMLTARDSEQDVIAGLETGADDYLTKPFSMRELRARVNALLRRDSLSRAAGPTAARTATEVLSAGNLEMDLGRHVVRRDGVEVALRPREYQLLEYLMRNPGLLMSREVLLERVWGYTYAGESRTVDVHVRWLREKLEATPSEPRHIQTVRGFGYRFVP